MEKNETEIKIIINNELKDRLDEIAISCGNNLNEFILKMLNWFADRYHIKQLNNKTSYYYTEDEVIEMLDNF
jgi:hypothetical protein